ncbi:MAG: ribonuclease R [Thermoguttaceae bacterium]|nr:ribonuclease R [Thermoguttaceae bacterium]MDW8037713.1 ribonuclease R [Thermoguttaceae bacterium]
MNETDLTATVLQLVRRPDYQPMKLRQLAQLLGLSKKERASLRKLIKRLAERGEVGYVGGRLMKAGHDTQALVRPAANQLVGTFRRMEAGYGFVRPKMPGWQEDRQEDIYIPAQYAGDASTGDEVLVELSRARGPKGKLQGRILRVLQRQTYQFVGTYFERAGRGYVQVDGTVFARPIPVGDPGAKNVRPDDKVVFEMVRFPSAWHQGEGVITEVLGPRGQPGVDTLSIIREFDLPDEFPPDVLEEARREADAFQEIIPPWRRDLTELTIITIDPEDARDFDDAISLELLPNGHWLLGVHIADVAYFVRPQSALDREARHRSTSVYLPDRVLPMLPEVISNSLASLQPGKLRYTKSVFIEYTPEGDRRNVEFCHSAIRSTKRLTYEQVDAFLADPAPWRRKLGAKVHDLLGRMHQLAMILRRRRMQRGALELFLPEVKILLDDQGRVSGARLIEHTESHQIIEEFMLAANEAVAERLRDAGVPFLRRIHKPPTTKKLRELAEFVQELGLKTNGLQDRFELQKVLQQTTGRPEQHAVHYAVLRSLQRAVYSPEAEGHFALASSCYCHFTSPIRRYPDLTIHRLLGALIDGRHPHSDLRELLVLGQHCSDREERAELAERELTKWKMLAYLENRLGMEMDAVITGVESFGLFVQGLELPAEGLIHVDSLMDDYYYYDRTAHSLCGRIRGNQFRLGDVVRVAVARVDLDRRELDFRLVSPAGKNSLPPSVRRRR